ncbi:Hsp70 family protein [Saccharothrix isguenensis]
MERHAGRFDVRYGLGVDLGTTFTAAAVSGESGTRVLSLGRNVVAPSTVFATPEGRLLTGDAAEIAGASDPTRVSRGHKRRLGDPTPIVIGGTAYSPQVLMAAQLRDVVALATAQEGTPPDTIVLTCPAVWGPYRREHFDQVPHLAGLPGAHIVTEPEAAATHYTVERRLGTGETIAVYDLGGGTFDATILRATTTGMEILGTPEGIERLGGIDFDEALLSHVDQRSGQALSALDPTRPDTATVLAAARALVTGAKETLSTEPDVTLTVPLPDGKRSVTTTRVEFNEMIRPSVALTTEALQRTVHSAGLRPDDIAAVLLAGGSSRIPLVPQMVSEAFGTPIRVSLHPKFTVALGAAAIARSTTAATPSPAVAPVPPTAAATGRRRSRWLVPAVAAATAVVVGTAATVWSLSGDDEPTAAPAPTTQPSATTHSAATSTSRDPGSPTDLRLLDGEAVVAPYVGMVGSPENWAGTRVEPDRAVAHTAVSATASPAGLRTTWNGSGSGQVYLQNTEGGADLRRFLDGGGAIVLDLVVHSRPADATSLSVHCTFPCASEVPTTSAFRELPVGRESTVTVPVSCFTSTGLDIGRVDTAFLLSTAGAFDATFTRIRWVAGAVDAPACDELG